MIFLHYLKMLFGEINVTAGNPDIRSGVQIESISLVIYKTISVETLRYSFQFHW